MVVRNMVPIGSVTTPSLMKPRQISPPLKVAKSQNPATQYPPGLSDGQKRRYRRRLEREEKKRIALLNPMTILIGDKVMVKPLKADTPAKLAAWTLKMQDRISVRKARNQRRAERRALRKQPGYVEPPQQGRFTPFYLAYIRSNAWQDKRQEVFAIHGRQCVRCGGFKNLQCHHKTYERLGNENAKTDLEVLCLGCHEAEHGRKFGCRSK